MPQSLRLGIKAVPNSSRDEISGWLGDDLKIRICRPAKDGKANRQICLVLAEKLGLPARDVSVVAGASSARKTVEIRGLSADQVTARLGRCVAGRLAPCRAN